MSRICNGNRKQRSVHPIIALLISVDFNRSRRIRTLFTPGLFIDRVPFLTNRLLMRAVSRYLQPDCITVKLVNGRSYCNCGSFGRRTAKDLVARRRTPHDRHWRRRN